MDEKKKRIRIIIGCIVGFIVFSIVMGAIETGKQEERFAANKEQILGDLRSAIDSKDLTKCDVIVDEYKYVDDHELKLLLSDYNALKDQVAAAAEQAKEQAKIDAVTAKVGVPFKGDILEITIKKVQILDTVGGAILNESAQRGVKYLAVDYSYKNISKEPTHETPDIYVISPDGATYDIDLSATGMYAGQSDDYNEEILSGLNPQVYSNSVDVYKVPESITVQTGWKLKVVYEGSMINKSYERFLNIN